MSKRNIPPTFTNVIDPKEFYFDTSIKAFVPDYFYKLGKHQEAFSGIQASVTIDTLRKRDFKAPDGCTRTEDALLEVLNPDSERYRHGHLVRLACNPLGIVLYKGHAFFPLHEFEATCTPSFRRYNCSPHSREPTLNTKLIVGGSYAISKEFLSKRKRIEGMLGKRTEWIEEDEETIALSPFRFLAEPTQKSNKRPSVKELPIRQLLQNEYQKLLRGE